MAAAKKSKKRSTTTRRRRSRERDIVQVVTTSEDLFALTEDGMVYQLVERNEEYGWHELSPITDETIFNLEDEEDGEDEAAE